MREFVKFYSVIKNFIIIKKYIFVFTVLKEKLNIFYKQMCFKNYANISLCLC